MQLWCDSWPEKRSGSLVKGGRGDWKDEKILTYILNKKKG